jgi:hypothetical protein
MTKNRLEGASQQPQPSAPVWPSLRAAVTCSKVTRNKDGTCMLEGVSAGFMPSWRGTAEMPAPLSFVVYVELFAHDFEPAPDARLRIEIRAPNGQSMGKTSGGPMSFGRGKTTVGVEFQDITMMVAGEGVLTLQLFWGERFLAGIPVMIREAGFKPAVEGESAAKHGDRAQN